MFDETYVKSYGEPKQYSPDIRKNYIACRTYCDRSNETDSHCRCDATTVPPVHSSGYERAQYDVKGVQNVENYMRGFVRKPNKNHNAHENHSTKSPKGREGSVSLEFVSDLL